MIVDTHAGMTGTGATPVEVGAKHIRWGLWLFIFGLVIDYVVGALYARLVRAGGRGVPQERLAVVGLCV